jgi:hypothetical protein
VHTAGATLAHTAGLHQCTLWGNIVHTARATLAHTAVLHQVHTLTKLQLCDTSFLSNKLGAPDLQRLPLLDLPPTAP